MERSPFGKLPPELRTIIWEMALEVDRVAICYNKHCSCPVFPRGVLAVAQTCKAAYRECPPIIYHVNVFAFCDPHQDVDCTIRSFLHSIGSTNAAAVARIRVAFIISMYNICPVRLPERLKSIVAIKKKFCTSQRKMELEPRVEAMGPYYETKILQIDLQQAKESWSIALLELDSVREKLSDDRFADAYSHRPTFSRSFEKLKGIIDKMENEW